jgi:hypothetical protein
VEYQRKGAAQCPADIADDKGKRAEDQNKKKIDSTEVMEPVQNTGVRQTPDKGSNRVREHDTGEDYLDRNLETIRSPSQTVSIRCIAVADTISL